MPSLERCDRLIAYTKKRLAEVQAIPDCSGDDAKGDAGMGKCIASGYTRPQITVCENCFHRQVCGDKDYLTENDCCNCVEEGRLVVLPNIKHGDTVYVPNFNPYWGKVLKSEVRGIHYVADLYDDHTWEIDIGEYENDLRSKWFLSSEEAHAAIDAQSRGDK